LRKTSVASRPARVLPSSQTGSRFSSSGADRLAKPVAASVRAGDAGRTAAPDDGSLELRLQRAERLGHRFTPAPSGTVVQRVWQEVVPGGWHDTESGWYYTPYDRFADPEGRLEGDEDFQQSYPDFDRRVKLAEIDAVRKPKPVEAGVPPQPKIKKKKKNRGKAQKNALERYEGAAKDKIEAALKSVVAISWVLVTLDSDGPLLRCGDGEVECHLHLSADGTKVRDGNVRLSGEKRGGTQGGVPLRPKGSTPTIVRL
jgi:hypothetical protein